MKTWYHSSYARATRSLVTVRLDRGEIGRIVTALEERLGSLRGCGDGRAMPDRELVQEIARTKELLAGFKVSIQ